MKIVIGGVFTNHCTLFGWLACFLLPLQLLTKIHNVVPADGTVINHNIPGPEGYCIPLQREKGGTMHATLLTQAHARAHVHTHTHTHTPGFHPVVITFLATKTTKQEFLDVTWLFFFLIISESISRLQVCLPIL